MGGGGSFQERTARVTGQLFDQAKAQADKIEAERAQRVKERQNELMGQFAEGLEADLAKGRERGQELFGQGALGTRAQGEITQDFGDIVQRRRAALEGLTPEERNAMESQVLDQIGRQSQTQLRQLRGIQGAQGIRGGLAAAQQADILRQAQAQQAGAARDIFLKNIEARRQALGDFEATVGGEQERRQREIMGQLTTEFGFGQLGQAGRAAAVQGALGEQQAEAGRAAALRAEQQAGGKK